MAGPNITILYGSQTGTAQDIAEQIWKRSKRYKLRSSVDAMDDYDTNKFVSEQVLIFVIATAGQGDTPLNMKNIWKFLLKKNLPSDYLSSATFSVLGLGDSSFEKYNFAAKKFNKRLIQLGARELLPMALADDQHDYGLDGVFEPWMRNVFHEICSKFHLPMEPVIPEHEIIERFKVDVLQYTITVDSEVDIYQYEAEKNDVLIKSTVIDNIRTTHEDHFQDARLIRFKTPELNYSPGDIVYIRAYNSNEQVDKFFKVLIENGANVHPDMAVHVSEKEIKLPVALERKLRLKQIVQQYWDLSCIPKRSAIEILSLISENQTEKEKLKQFTKPFSQEDRYNYINRPRRNIIEVLNDFPHTTSKLTVRLLFEIMDPIKPRAFSIASSSKQTKDEVHLLVVVVRYFTSLIKPRLGLCSNWLASLKPNDKAIFSIQKGTFKFDYKKPMILIGPGTGLAPFRSLLIDKAYVDGDLSSCVLFFGCRNKEKDYHCQEDLEYFEQRYSLRLYCAFSRDQPEKIYVQHVIRQQMNLCWEFLQGGGSIYVAGSSKNMPKDVRAEIYYMIRSSSRMNGKEVEEFIADLEKSGRYQTETW